MAEQTESSWTESRFRQRLVGASVVVALAVLLLPLWLDGSGIDSLKVQTAPEKPAVEGAEGIEIPGPPGDSGKPLEEPPQSLFPDQTQPEPAEEEVSRAESGGADAPSVEESEVEAGSIPEELGVSPDRASPSEDVAESEPAASAADESSEPKPESDDSGSGEESNAQESSAQADEDRDSAEAETKTEPKSSDAAGDLPEISESGEYVVQLGSFSDEQNARALASSVKSSGFDVSVTPLFSEQGTVWRVRVGPYATREHAGEATERLRQRIGRDGLVMSK